MKPTFKSTVYACYFGLITQAIVNNLAPLLFVVFQDRFKISFEMIGRLVLINFGTQLVVDALSVKFVDKIGYRISIISAHIFCTIGLVALGILPNVFPSAYAGLITAVILYAIGGGLIEVLVSPILDSLPGDAKASAMSMLHSFYCWGQLGVVLVSTVILKVFGHGIWFVLPVLWSVIPLINMIRFTRVPLMPAIADHERIPVKQLLSSRVFIFSLILMMCAGASELAMSQWSSLFAEKGLQVPKLVGDILGPCLFAAFMGIGRSVYGILGQKINIEKALLGSSVLCVFCYAVTAIVRTPVISLLGCALCGLSVSLMWPGIFSLTAARYPKGGTAMFGMLAIFGDLGCSVGPWIAGIISDTVQKSSKFAVLESHYGLSSVQLGLKSGILVAAIFPIIMCMVTLISHKRNKTPD